MSLTYNVENNNCEKYNKNLANIIKINLHK